MAIRPISNDLQKRAREELHEDPDAIEENLTHIRGWLQKQPHLNVRPDDQWIISFLRGCKYSLERTKEKLDYFHTVRGLLPEFFDNRDPLLPEIQEILNANYFALLPSTADSAGPRIFLSRLKSKTDTVTVNNLAKVYFMCLDILMLEDDNSNIAGAIHIVDFKDVPIKLATQCTPTFCQKLVLCLQGKYPIRLKEVSYINVSSILEVVYTTVKNFMNDKLKKRIFLYNESNTEKLFERIPRRVFPEEYGGDSGSMDALCANFKEKIESYREWFLEDEKYRTDEQLRPKSSKTYNDLFGAEGSFRKLNID